MYLLNYLLNKNIRESLLAESTVINRILCDNFFVLIINAKVLLINDKSSLPFALIYQSSFDYQDRLRILLYIIKSEVVPFKLII